MRKAAHALCIWLWLSLVATSAMAQEGSFVYEGQTSVLSVKAQPGVNYTWELYNQVDGINLANVPGNCPENEAHFLEGVSSGERVEVRWLKAGFFFFKVTAFSSCTNNLKLGQMEVREFPEADLLEPEPVCSGDTAIFTIQVIKGARPLSATISNGDETWTIENINDTFHDFALVPTPTQAGTYDYWITSVTDVYGMTNDTIKDPVTLTIYPLPEIEAIPSYGPFCVYEEPVTFNETEGVFTYNGNVIHGWNPGNPGSGIHEVIYSVTDSETGCENSWVVEIIVYPLPDFVYPSYGPFCVGDQPIFFSEKGKFTYEGNQIFGWDPSTPGSFVVTFLYTDDKTGCEDSCELTIEVHEAVIAKAGPDQFITIPITPYTQPYESVSTWLEGNDPHPVTGTWTFEEIPSNTIIPSIENPSSSNTRVTWPGISKGIYVFRWTIQNIACPDSWDQMTVEIIPKPNIPDGFTPDGDGSGDTWTIIGLDHYPDHVVRVYNHWGTLVFEAAPYDTPWDGVANSGHIITGKGQRLPAGVYFYVITLDRGLAPISGAVHLFY